MGVLEEKALDCLDPKNKNYIDLKETKAMLETFGFGKHSILYSVLVDCEQDKRAKEIKHETLLIALRNQQLSSSQQRGRFVTHRRPRE
jgi:Ca2+-binding EF-hand superfamily protein